jgi:hypothetical protein
MYILFVDESGTPPARPLGADRYFVLGGVIIPVGEWRTVRDRLQGVKTRHHVMGELKWRYFAPNNDDDENPLKGRPFAERDRIRTECLNIITGIKSIKVIAAIASSEAIYEMPSVTTADDVYAFTYKVLSERFQYFLQDMSRLTGSQQCGIVVADHRGADGDHALRALHHRLLAGPGMYTSRYNSFIETLFFAPSHMSVGIQLADMVAGAVWRKYARNEDRCYKLIEDAVRKGPTGRVDGYGIVKVPKEGWR